MIISNGKAKGPASAATDPDHGSKLIPTQDTNMNSTDNITAKPHEAMVPRFCAIPLEDLRNLFDGLQAAHHVLLVNEWNCNGSSLTGSYLWFKAEAARLNVVMQEIADSAFNCCPVDDDEEWEREQILVRAKPYRVGPRIYRTTTTVEALS